MTAKKELGLYIHIPFCLSKCRYCDFCSFPHPKPESVEKYLSALIDEIEEYKAEYSEYNVTTVYFGGGTPTLLKVEQLGAVLRKLSACFNISPSAEITAECNPATADTEYFEALRKAGINRLSIGIQSMDDGELRLLGRLHKSADAQKAFEDAKAAGFVNISADIMFGIPSQTKESLERTIDKVCELGPTHISLYGLKIENGTYFARHAHELELPDEDTEYEMYISSVKRLATHRFERYEISNFAKDGYYSRHNMKYWMREDYLGIGLAAHSCIGSRRFSNTSDMENYLNNKRSDTNETVSEHDILCEKIMLGMRLEKGCNMTALEAEYGEKLLSYRKALEGYAEGGYVNKKGDFLSFSDKGMYISNYILSEILDFED